MVYYDREFYDKDEKKYELKTNIEFINWYLTSIDNGTRPFKNTTIDDLESLINNVCEWYKLRYPEFLLKPYSLNPMGEQRRNLEDISSYLKADQFIHRLPFIHYLLMNCEYSGTSSGNYSKYENGRKVHKSWVGNKIHGKDRDYSVLYESKTGIILESDFKGVKGLNIEELLNLLKYEEKLDTSDLKKTIDQYYFDIELRHRLLQLSALKILYTHTDIENPEIGYKRASKFIEEFNSELGLKLSSNEIDELYNDYLLSKNRKRLYR